jgi:TolB protein
MRRPIPAVLVLLLIAACADEPVTPLIPSYEAALSSLAGKPGGIVYTHRPPSNTPVNLWLMDPDGGNQRQITFSPAGVGNITPDWSPDGKLIAFTSTRDGNAEIFVMGPEERGDPAQLTFTSGSIVNQGPVWSPNGKQIAFYSSRDGDTEIYLMDADGSNVRQLTFNTIPDEYPDFSPNGKLIAWQSGGDIYLMDLRDGSTTLVWDAPFRSDMPEFSPDGKQLTFMDRGPADRLGCFVMTINVDGTGALNLTPRAADTPLPWCNFFPSWSKNGQHIYFGAQRYDVAGGDAEIFVIDHRTLELTRLTDRPGMDSAPMQR